MTPDDDPEDGNFFKGIVWAIGITGGAILIIAIAWSVTTWWT